MLTPPRLAFLVLCSVIGALMLIVSLVIVAEDGAEHYATVATVAPSTTTTLGRPARSSSTAVGIPSVTATVPPVTAPPVSPTAGPVPTAPPPSTTVAKQYVPVLRLSGVGDQKSPTVTLTGAPARIQYQSIGPLTVYLLPASQTGGHTSSDQPLVRCAQACPVSTANFSDQAGSFYLDVVASSSWALQLEEAR